MGIRIDGASDLINATDGSLTIEGQSVNTTGIITASGGMKVGSAATIHSTGQFNIGVAATIFPNGNATFAGIVTAASYNGDGSALTGIAGTEITNSDFQVGVSTFFVDYSTTNIGVGTDSPYNNAGTNVHIHSANTTSEIRFTNSTTGGGNNGGTIQQGGTSLYVSNSEAGSIVFENNGSARARIDSSGRLLIGHTSSLGEVWNDDGGSLQVAGTSYLSSTFQISRWGNNASCPHIIMGKSRGGAVGTNVVVQDDDTCGLIAFAADDGTDLHSAVAEIRAAVDGTPGSNDTPGRLVFSTTPDGSNSRSERMRINNSGQVLIGRTSNQTSRNNTSNRNPVFQVSSPWSSGRGSMSFECTDDYPIVFLNSNASYADNSGSGVLVWSIKDGSGEYCNTGEIRCEVDGTPGDDDSPGRMEFFTTPDGTAQPSERMRIDSSGRVIIARSGSAGELNSNDAALHVTAPTDGGQGGIYIHCNSQSGGTVAAHYGLKIDAVNCANNANPQCGAIINVVQQYTASETGVKCSVEGSYNTTTCYEANLTKNLAAITNGYSYYSNIVTTNSGGNAYHFRGQDDGALAIYILENGNIQNANNSYGSTSDLKLKENIVDASSQWNDIKNVKVRKFNFKTKPSETFIGVVAQEIETTSPGLVHTENDIETDDATGEGTITGTTKSVKYSILYMKAIKALQEAMTRIETLETKVAALESA